MSTAKFVSPKGVLNWAFISGQGKRNDLNGNMEYSIDVQVPAQEAQEAVKSIDDFWVANRPKGAKEAKSLGYRVNEDGSVTFKFKTKTTYPSGDPKKIRTFDSKGKEFEMAQETRIGNGSKGRAAGVMSIYDASAAARGVSLWLDSVQISKLVEYQGGSSFGADDEEDGFEADTGPF